MPCSFFLFFFERLRVFLVFLHYFIQWDSCLHKFLSEDRVSFLLLSILALAILRVTGPLSHPLRFVK